MQAVFRRFMRQGIERMQDVGTWADVVDLVFTPTTDYFNYTHLLGWLLLEGADPARLAGDGSPLPGRRGARRRARRAEMSTGRGHTRDRRCCRWRTDGRCSRRTSVKPWGRARA